MHVMAILDLNHLGRWFNGYHPVRGSLVALASGSAIVNIASYSRCINEIPSCKAIHCEQVCLEFLL